MVGKFRTAEATEWNSHGNMGRGKVRRKLTTRTLIKGHAVAAQDDARDEPAGDESAPDASARPAHPSPGGEGQAV